MPRQGWTRLDKAVQGLDQGGGFLLSSLQSLSLVATIALLPCVRSTGSPPVTTLNTYPSESNGKSDRHGDTTWDQRWWKIRRLKSSRSTDHKEDYIIFATNLPWIAGSFEGTYQGRQLQPTSSHWSPVENPTEMVGGWVFREPAWTGRSRLF
jgi:hypothetical protein